MTDRRSTGLAFGNDSVWGIVVAAGASTRFGNGVAKQYQPLGGRRVLDHSLTLLREVCGDRVVLVVAPELVGVREPLAGTVVAGGATRTASVRAGLEAIGADASIVLVHDAARPLVPSAVIDRLLAAIAHGADAAVPGVALADTVKRVDENGVVVETPVRSSMVAVQTPQAFRSDVLRRVHAAGGEATDDAALVEAAGGRVVVVAGDVLGRKITTTDDLAWLRSQHNAIVKDEAVSDASTFPELRVGQGFDIHPFSDDPSRPLILGGVLVEGAKGLVGHSDADAVAHAVTDSLLGAAGLGDIGQHFPDTDPAWKGADSMRLLAATVDLLRADGWTIVNVDTTVVLEAPKLASVRAHMAASLSEVCGAPVSVKAKRAEGLGSLGRREGIACLASALITRPRL